jgi:hypothetical protein
MTTNRDERDAILMLVNACNAYEIRSLALSSALIAMREYPREKRQSLSKADLKGEAAKAYTFAQANVEQQTKTVKVALEGSGPFLETLPKFATRHYLDFTFHVPDTEPTVGSESVPVQSAATPET